MAFINDFKRFFGQSSMLVRLILINVFVFVLIRLLSIGTLLVTGDSMAVTQWVALPGDLWSLLKRPWTLLTYMFVHADLWHILFNMLWLYWMGSIFMEFFSSKQFSGLYLLGGWGGALLYLLAFNLRLASGAGSVLVGSSAAVIAIVVATAVYVPDYKIGLLFLGQVAVKWVAIVTVLIAVFSLDAGNVGGSIAHIGGAAVGAWFSVAIKRGSDITRPLNAIIDAFVALFNGRSMVKPQWLQGNRQSRKSRSASVGNSSSRRPSPEVSEEELDAILDKIKAAGYDALTNEERDKLFKVSRQK